MNSTEKEELAYSILDQVAAIKNMMQAEQAARTFAFTLRGLLNEKPWEKEKSSEVYQRVVALQWMKEHYDRVSAMVDATAALADVAYASLMELAEV